MASLGPPLFIFGGTFNPPHQGHVAAALQAVRYCGGNAIGLMPCKQPPHKNDVLPEIHRVEMVAALSRAYDEIFIERAEMSLPSPSYSVQTMAHIQVREKNRPICFLIGEDSLYNLHTWYQWENLLEHCHIVVMRRHVQDLAMNTDVKAIVELNESTCAADLHQLPCGKLFMVESDYCDVSSTQLRETIKKGGVSQPLLQKWLHPNVLNYINKNQLYI